MMNQNKISKKVMELEYGMYRISCDCISDDHDTTIWFDYDEETNMVYLQICKDFFVYEPYLDGFWKNFWKQTVYRIKSCLKILFTGQMKINDSVILREPEHINNFIIALQESKKFVEKGAKAYEKSPK